MSCWDTYLTIVFSIGLGLAYATIFINVVLCTISAGRIKKRLNQVGTKGRSAPPLATASNLKAIKTQRDPQSPKEPKDTKDPKDLKDPEAPKDQEGHKGTKASSAQLSVETEMTQVVARS
ncbi:uncharacterized protein LOC131938190 [Physella acuta]|uniref:uncharacterized protein LOC131938190 n=1 Tax=Physella acuta TaxID=109671 RepID=UPI0027DABBE8|nr:uncharacterized protein LOC131938190 [Physella acuta]